METISILNSALNTNFFAIVEVLCFGYFMYLIQHHLITNVFNDIALRCYQRRATRKANAIQAERLEISKLDYSRLLKKCRQYGLVTGRAPKREVLVDLIVNRIFA